MQSIRKTFVKVHVNNDAIVESNYGLEGKKQGCYNEYVEKAINEKVYRNNRIEERLVK